MGDSEYHNALASMFRLHRFGIKLGLDTITAMLSALGDPHKQFKTIHIAGTNGKGSVAAMLTAILRASGYSVGRYTSPHLERFNERICIDDQPISDDEVVMDYQQVMAIEDLPRQPTFFEFTTAMAFEAFARHQVEWAVIETGMGGRLDATSVIDPVLSIITNISLEHKQYLGGTLPLIAGEKAGIIKPKVPVVSGVRQKTARAVIARKAAKERARLIQMGNDVKYRRHATKGFSYFGLYHRWRNIQMSLAGEHQVDNASLVLAACELLDHNRIADIDEASVRKGLISASWSGRLEIACKAPFVILDGAHNLMAARVLGRYLKRHFSDRDITLVVGVLDDKPYASILKDLIGPSRRVVVTQPRIDRAVPVERLASVAKRFNENVTIEKDVGDALRYAISSSSPEDVICVAGSLYVVGEAKTALTEMVKAGAEPNPCLDLKRKIH